MSAIGTQVIRGAATFCPLLDKSGQRWISARDGLSSFDPKRTLRLIKHLMRRFSLAARPQSARLLAIAQSAVLAGEACKGAGLSRFSAVPLTART